MVVVVPDGGFVDPLAGGRVDELLVGHGSHGGDEALLGGAKLRQQHDVRHAAILLIDLGVDLVEVVLGGGLSGGDLTEPRGHLDIPEYKVADEIADVPLRADLARLGAGVVEPIEDDAHAHHPIGEPLKNGVANLHPHNVEPAARTDKASRPPHQTAPIADVRQIDVPAADAHACPLLQHEPGQLVEAYRPGVIAQDP